MLQPSHYQVVTKMNLIKLQKIIAIIFTVMIFVAIGLFFTNQYFSIHPAFYFILYVIAGVNLILMTYNRGGKINKIISAVIAALLLIVLGMYFSLDFGIWLISKIS